MITKSCSQGKQTSWSHKTDTNLTCGKLRLTKYTHLSLLMVKIMKQLLASDLSRASLRNDRGTLTHTKNSA